jgi:hypothetical protein
MSRRTPRKSQHQQKRNRHSSSGLDQTVSAMGAGGVGTYAPTTSGYVSDLSDDERRTLGYVRADFSRAIVSVGVVALLIAGAYVASTKYEEKINAFGKTVTEQIGLTGEGS